MKIILIIVLVFNAQILLGQSVEGNVDKLPVKEYTLTVKEELVNKTGKFVKGMTVNGSIPGPVLEFVEGEYAVIYVKNEMSVETSIHWHGILLPNFYDGVPYLTTPPIKPGTTFKYEFALKQSGTYWYHSHTMLQEQSGVFGSFIIKPKKKPATYDKELVLMLSDWTDEKPKDVLRTLKRGSDWYTIKKGSSTPLNQVIARKALGAQLDFWRQRMEGSDIADVYYPAFLINGQKTMDYPDFKPGEKLRLRIIDGAASTSFWISFGAKTPTLIAADGLDVVPVKKNKIFIGVAETYDFIVTIPDNGRIEFKIMAQDGSGGATAYFGTGKTLIAKEISKPDNILMMQQMSQMKMKMGAHGLKFRPKKDERQKMREEYGMDMNHEPEIEAKDHQQMKMPSDSVMVKKAEPLKMDHDHMEMSHDTLPVKKMDSTAIDHSTMDHSKMKMENTKGHEMHGDGMTGMDMFAEYNYDYLKSPEKTSYSKDLPVKEILLNLTGNMNRYIWSMNGVPLSEADKIKVKAGEVTRITFNNLTMMHHPMHLHGHFFRVINKNGKYSPLKHTVNVPPMAEITIEFYGNEYGDWFFHCHILYHMMSGMTRIFSYDSHRDNRMEPYPMSKLINEDKHFYAWSMLDAASHMSGFNYIASNIRNQFNISAEYGWNKNLEAEFTYERYLHDNLRIFTGLNIENELEDSLDEISTTAVVGIRYLTPYLFNLDLRTDNKLRPQISLSREILIFPRTAIFGSYEYQADFGLINNLGMGDNFKKEVTWTAGIEYMLSKNISIMTSYDNRFGAGGGLSVRF